MTKRSLPTLMISLSLAIPTLLVGCDGSGGDGTPNPMPGPSGTSPQGPGGTSAPGIKQIMVTLAKGPNSLTPVLGKELNEGQPAWETIQGQTKEYARLAAEMNKYDPPKGSKDSWVKFTSEYANDANDLDKAAQAKDKEAALAAHGQLTNSCNDCHREHRQMGPRGGGPGGPGGPRGGGPGGPPGGAPPK
jgi:hypothetical protein